MDGGFTAEARWFVPVRGSLLAAPERPPDLVRVDAYHLDTLTPRSAWKRRGGTRWFEYKELVGQPVPIVIRGATGAVETWAKQRTRRPPDADGAWISVRKQTWRAAAAELSLVHVGDAAWWSVATGASGPGSGEFDRWWDVLACAGLAAAYPAWLLGSVPASKVCVKPRGAG